MGPIVDGSDAQTWSGTGPLEGRVPGIESSVYKRKNLVQRAVAGGAQWVKCGPEGGGLLGSYQAALKHSPMVLRGVQQRHLWQKATLTGRQIPELFPTGSIRGKDLFSYLYKNLSLREKAFSFSPVNVMLTGGLSSNPSILAWTPGEKGPKKAVQNSWPTQKVGTQAIFI